MHQVRITSCVAVKFMPCTLSRGERFKVTIGEKSVVLSREYAADHENIVDEMKHAAKVGMEAMGVTWDIVAGTYYKGEYIFVASSIRNV